MPDGTLTPVARRRKPEEYEEARRLRREQGMSLKRIGSRLGVSPSSVMHWTRDIELTPEQVTRNLGRGITADREIVGRRARAWSERNRRRRRSFQEDGRRRARERDPLHIAGCLLYWAEGSKSRNGLKFANSDLNMVRLFWRFLRTSLQIEPERITLRLNVYTNNGLSVREIEDFWLSALELPRSCLRKHSLNHYPTSSSGKRKRKLPYGVCTLCLYDTRVVQHIYGAIQEYAGFDEPRWLG
jgi:transcriptional regulator with XRE-family HTH domain